MKCTACGKEVPPENRFCIHCGAPVSQGESEAVMKCTACGKEIPPGNKFCTNCGTPVPPVESAAPVKCTACGKEILPGDRFCANCGTPVPPVESAAASIMKCTACGKEIPLGNKFCTNCGTPVSSVEGASPANEEETNLVVLNDEDGNEITFELLDLIPYRDNEYVVVLPVDEDAKEVVILQLEDAGEEENYVSVGDQATLDAVFAIFKEQNKDSFNFD